MSESDLKTISYGEQPQWEEEFDHPKLGKLTFRGKLPTSREIAQHSVEMDNLLSDLAGDAEARTGTLVLVAALAGVKTLLTCPVISERREHDAELQREKVLQEYYDPEEDPNTEFVVEVWTSFSAWRMSFLDQVEELKNSSGETPGPESGEPSTATTVSPSTTPA